VLTPASISDIFPPFFFLHDDLVSFFVTLGEWMTARGFGWDCLSVFFLVRQALFFGGFFFFRVTYCCQLNTVIQLPQSPTPKCSVRTHTGPFYSSSTGDIALVVSECFPMSTDPLDVDRGLDTDLPGLR